MLPVGHQRQVQQLFELGAEAADDGVRVGQQAGVADQAEMDTAVSPGETEVSVSLDVVFELGK